MGTIQEQYIVLDGQLRAKADTFTADSLPSPEDIQEMHNMESGLETMKLKMELEAIKSGLIRVQADPQAQLYAATPEAVSMGTEEAIMKFLESDHFATRSKADFRLGVAGASEGESLAMKTLFTTSAGWTPRAPFSGIVAPAPVRTPTALQYIQQIPTSEAAIVYMVQSTHTDNSQPVNEGAAPGEQAYVYTTTTAQVRRISAILPVTEEVLADIPQMQALLQVNLMGDLERKVESNVLEGNGTAPNFRGVSNLTNINTQAKGADSILDAIYKGRVLATKNGFVPPDLLVIHPDDLQDIVLEKSVGAASVATGEAAATNLVGTYPQGYIWGNPISGPPPFIWGMRVLESTGVSAGAACSGPSAPRFTCATARMLPSSSAPLVASSTRAS